MKPFECHGLFIIPSIDIPTYVYPQPPWWAFWRKKNREINCYVLDKRVYCSYAVAAKILKECKADN